MTKRNLTITTLTVLPAIVLFGVGVILGQRLMFRAFGVQLRGVQATLLFDRIVQEREIKTLLVRGCVEDEFSRSFQYSQRQCARLEGVFARELRTHGSSTIPGVLTASSRSPGAALINS
jgi:hypothetical protein